MKDLVRNPIGIIALFISLIYAFASLLLGTTAGVLDQAERFPIIVFIVLFPIIVLGAFYLLVTRHHGKLYAPADYKDDKSFLVTLNQRQREQKLDKEVQEVERTESEQTEVPPNQESPGDRARGPTQLAKSSTALRSELQLVESLTVAKFESEFQLRAERDVGVGGTEVSFDAFFSTKDKLTFLEVKTLRHPASFGMVLDRVLYSAVLADKALSSNFRLILALVHDLSEEDVQRVQRIWRRRVDGCPASVELRMIARSELGG